MTLRVGFAGTPSFASTALAAIAEAGFTIPLVITRPDKPKGRGLQVEASRVKQEALRRGLAVLQPPSLRPAGASRDLLDHPLDVLVVAAYGLILPQRVLDGPRHGCLNIHGSRLPRWRGAAPIQRAIEAGDSASGITIMQMDAGLDTGAIVEVACVAIDARETAGSLHDKLAATGAVTVVQVLQRLDREGRLRSTPQPTDGVSYAAKITGAQARIDWSAAALAIDRQVRAFDPVPGAFTSLNGRPIKLWRAEPSAAPAAAAPGSIVAVDESIDVACGAGLLRVFELQPAGGRRMTARAFASGRSLRGVQFADPAAAK